MKEIGSRWWFDPVVAGYPNGVRPWNATIIALYDGPPVEAGVPARQYIIRLHTYNARHIVGDVQLFANDDALQPLNASETGPLTIRDVEKALDQANGPVLVLEDDDMASFNEEEHQNDLRAWDLIFQRWRRRKGA